MVKIPLFAQTEERIFGDIMFDLVSNTVLTRSSPGSKTRAMAQAVSKKMGRMWSQFDINIIQAFIDGAEGQYLNFIGAMMGVERLGETPATITATDKVVKLFVEVGTFGSINSGQSILVPAGTQISTLPDNSGTLYSIPFSVVLSADSNTAFIAVESNRTGSTAHVGTNTLINHNFVDYTDTLNNTLKITNESEITTARALESDTNYKFRISNQIVAAETSNSTAIRLAALEVPGVSDILVIPFNRGIGTFDLLIKATTPSVPIGLILAVTDSVGSSSALGIIPNIRTPREIGVSLTATLTLRGSVVIGEEAEIITAATDNIRGYINNLDIGEEFIVNEVVERALSTSDNIRNIGSANQPLDEVFIYTPSSLEDNKVRETLIGDFNPKIDDRLLVERDSAGATPILIRTAT